MSLQDHPRSLTLGPIESSYVTSYWSSIIVTLVLFCRVWAILMTLELLYAESHFLADRT